MLLHIAGVFCPGSNEWHKYVFAVCAYCAAEVTIGLKVGLNFQIQARIELEIDMMLFAIWRSYDNSRCTDYRAAHRQFIHNVSHVTYDAANACCTKRAVGGSFPVR